LLMSDLMVFAPMGEALVYSEKKQADIIKRVYERIDSCWGIERLIYIINPDEYQRVMLGVLG
jgi:hypothetical protein